MKKILALIVATLALLGLGRLPAGDATPAASPTNSPFAPPGYNPAPSAPAADPDVPPPLPEAPTRVIPGRTTLVPPPSPQNDAATLQTPPSLPMPPTVGAPPIPGQFDTPPVPPTTSAQFPRGARPTVGTTAPAPGAPRPLAPGVPAATLPGAPAAALPGVPPAPGAVAGEPAMAGDGTLLRQNVLPAGAIKFQATPLEQVLDLYSELTGRTVLRPNQLPASAVTFKTATDLSLEEAVQALDSVLTLNGIAMIPVGEKFVTAVPSAQALQEGAAFSKVDPEELPETGQYVTKIFQLKFAKPSEVAQVVQGFGKLPNGILPIDSTQTLVVRDYAANIKRMVELIEKVDIDIPLEFELELIPIKYALASDIASVISSLSSGGAVSGVGTTAGLGGGTAGRTGGLSGRRGGLMSGGGRGRSLGVGGGFGGAGTAQPGVQPQAAVGGVAGRSSTFQQRLQNIVSRAAGGGDLAILGEAKIIPDERMNAILIFANKQDIAMIKKIIAQLDVVQAQVLIEAIVLEVTLSDGKSFGISAGQRGKRFNSTVQGGGAVNNGKDALGAGSSFLSGVSRGTNALSAFPASGGLTYFTQLGSTWDLALTAIASDSAINVLSRPRIQTSHAVPAAIFVGESRPYVTGTYFGGSAYGSSSQYQEKQIGISLDVLPLINQDGLVVMEIQQQIQQVAGVQNIGGNDVPITSDRSANATVAVKNGETIMLGGFISSTKSTSKSGVPVLKDIPVLGKLFSSTSESKDRVELIVLIRPTVLPTPELAALHTEAERDRLGVTRRAEFEMLRDEQRDAQKAQEELRKLKQR